MCFRRRIPIHICIRKTYMEMKTFMLMTIWQRNVFISGTEGAQMFLSYAVAKNIGYAFRSHSQPNFNISA